MVEKYQRRGEYGAGYPAAAGPYAYKGKKAAPKNSPITKTTLLIQAILSLGMRRYAGVQPPSG